MRRTACVALCMLFLAVPRLSARIGAAPLDVLVEGSDLIVLAEVESVTKPLIGERKATARVLEVWKGSPIETVRFIAPPTWTCDISEAVEGETVVLFLAKGDHPRFYTIAYCGMRLRTVDGAAYATFWPEVRLPEGTPTIEGSEPERPFIRLVEVEVLRELIEDALRRKE